MERIVEDPFTVCKGRSALSSPTPISKLRAGAASPVVVGAAAASSSSDSSLSQGVIGGASDTSSQGSKGECPSFFVVFLCGCL